MNENNNITCSIENIGISGSTSEILCSLAIGLRELKSVVKELWINQVAEQTQLPIEVIQPIVENHFSKKRLNRPLLEGEIRHALSIKGETMVEAARYLGVHFDTLKKYCQLYDKSRVGGSENLSSGSTAPCLPISPLWAPTRGTKAIKKSI